MRKLHSWSGSIGALLVAGGVLLAVGPGDARAEVLVRETFSGVTDSSLLGPDVIPAASAWVNTSGHEAGTAPLFCNARGLANTYDHDNNPATPEVNVPGGYEVNGYLDNLPNHSLTISVVLPATLNPDGVASLTFWAAARRGGGSDGTAGAGVRIRNVTKGTDLVPLTAPRFAMNATQWQANRFTFPQLAAYAGNTVEITFNAGGADGASGLALADITFQTDAPVPSRACVPQEKDPQRHEGFMKEKQAALGRGPVQLVFIGDSITDIWRDAPQHKLFYARWGQYNPYNIGIAGDETQHVLWRIEHGELDGLDPKLVVLLIGTNNIGNQNQMTVGETVQGIQAVVKAIQAKLPRTRILLLGVFPRGAKPADRFRPMIQSINAAIAKLDDGGKSVSYLDLSDKFLDRAGNLPVDVMPDGLHPNAKGCEIWADGMKPLMDQLLK